MPSSKNARLFYRVAKQRFDDAQLLFNLKRTTAAVYLAGYSVECMLKSLILSAVPHTRESDVLEMFRGARAHDYEWLIRLYRQNGGAPIPPHLVPHFARVNRWSTDMRYSPSTIQRRTAKAFLDSTTEIIEWADGRL
jgi:HEPN domain-containing protein